LVIFSCWTWLLCVGHFISWCFMSLTFQLLWAYYIWTLSFTSHYGLGRVYLKLCFVSWVQLQPSLTFWYHYLQNIGRQIVTFPVTYGPKFSTYLFFSGQILFPVFRLQTFAMCHFLKLKGYASQSNMTTGK
jgi:hypothetical protein